LSPWAFPSNNESMRVREDENTPVSVPISVIPTQTAFYSLDVRQLNQSAACYRLSKRKTEPIVSNGKSYVGFQSSGKKIHTEQSCERRASYASNLAQAKKYRNSKEVTAANHTLSYQKARVVDLTRDFEENIIETIKRTPTKESGGCKVVRIRHGAKKNRGKKLEEMRHNDLKELKPHSRTVPLDSLFKTIEFNKHPRFPDKTFGKLLKDYLSKL
jgi:hypothetical protein